MGRFDPTLWDVDVDAVGSDVDLWENPPEVDAWGSNTKQDK